MDAPSPYDIREIRPDEAADALAMVDGGPAPEDLRRQLSVGAFAGDGGALLGVAMHEGLSTRGCVVHLHSEDPAVGRALLDRALQKAAAVGRRSSQVALHPQATAEAVWNISSWPARPAATQDPSPQAAEAEGGCESESDAESAVDTEAEAAADASAPDDAAAQAADDAPVAAEDPSPVSEESAAAAA